jgi:hypothetical protein
MPIVTTFLKALHLLDKFILPFCFLQHAKIFNSKASISGFIMCLSFFINEMGLILQMANLANTSNAQQQLGVTSLLL